MKTQSCSKSKTKTLNSKSISPKYKTNEIISKWKSSKYTKNIQIKTPLEEDPKSTSGTNYSALPNLWTHKNLKKSILTPQKLTKWTCAILKCRESKPKVKPCLAFKNTPISNKLIPSRNTNKLTLPVLILTRCSTWPRKRVKTLIDPNITKVWF